LIHHVERQWRLSGVEFDVPMDRSGSFSDLHVRRQRAAKAAGRASPPGQGLYNGSISACRTGRVINEATCEAAVSREALGDAVLFNRTGTR
jgi:hypothetical protein